MERVYSAAEARANLAQLVAEAGYAGREAVIQRNNKPIAVIIGYAQYQELRQQARERAARFAVYDQIRARNAEAEPAQVEADVAQAVKAVRARRRKR